MRFDSMCVAAAVLGVAFLTVAANPTFAQGNEPKATEQRPANGDSKDGQKKIDEYAEAEKLLGDPAANPECMWLGRRLVSLPGRDDLHTAFPHPHLSHPLGRPPRPTHTPFPSPLRPRPLPPT